MINKLSIFAVGLAIALPSAFANTVSLSIQETGVVGSLTASSATGFAQINASSYGDFQINNASGTGSPIFGSPQLNLQTLDVSTHSLATAHTLTIELTETGLTGIPNPFTFANAFTGILNGVTSETLRTYTDVTNTPFGMGHMVANHTFVEVPGNFAQSFNVNGSSPTASPFSETEIIIATFGATTTSDSLDSSILMKSAIPEPASLALIGSGLLGLALFRSRRSAKKQ